MYLINTTDSSSIFFALFHIQNLKILSNDQLLIIPRSKKTFKKITERFLLLRQDCGMVYHPPWQTFNKSIFEKRHLSS